VDLSGGRPAGADLSRPSAARVYDYFLGGAHNFEVDRQLAQQIARMTPNLAETMRANRRFLRRAVRFLVGAGIDQFLDIGSGIPTVGNVHEVAQDLNPAARVLYVDVDPVAVAHSRSILAGNDRAAVLQADLREPDRILAQAADSGLVDLSRPVAVLLAGVLHFIPDGDDPAGIAAELRAATAAGSYLLISHATDEDQPAEVIEAQRLSARTGTEIALRSRPVITGYFGDFSIVEPGVVFLGLWRPEPAGDDGQAPAGDGAEQPAGGVDPRDDAHPERVGALGGVARKDR
jgi:hypothetical protein